MKRILPILLSLYGCTGTFPKDAPWSFVSSVGGIAVDDPVRTANGLELPVRANVSGLETITVAPTFLNSMTACSRTRGRIKGQNIFVTIATSYPRAGEGPRCPPAQLGDLPSGEYNVYYGAGRDGAVFLRKIRVAL